MSSNHQYIVSFFNYSSFDSLEDAKFRISTTFTRQEALKYLKNKDENINHFIGTKLVSRTPIEVDELGNISFGKTKQTIK